MGAACRAHRAGTFREEWWHTVVGERPIFFFELEDETVWGATARMLHQLLRVAHGVDGPEPPALLTGQGPPATRTAA